MTAETLKSFITKFRKWLDGPASRALEGDDAQAVLAWWDDLALAEKLLDIKPELPIAFLGPSQQGKSSLINALLGENILAVGASVGACTSVITSIHYHPEDHFRAEIDFISLEEWKAALIKLREDLSARPSEDDTVQDQEERQESIKAAREKMEAVYRGVPEEALADILADARLRLPDEIVGLMNAGKPLVYDAANAQTFRNTVRRYLVGRDQHDDAQFWPVISRVRIYGRFDVLANGVVLVDLPGLNDPNPARERVTKKYLEDAQYIWLVCNSQTGIDRVFTNVLRDEGLLFRLFLEGRLDVFSVIATRIDDINIDAVLQQMGNEDASDEEVIEFRRDQIRRHVQDHLVQIAGEIVDKAAQADGGRDRARFLQRIRSVPVFAVSTSAYLNAVGLNNRYRGMKLPADDTHVPKLIDHLHTITREQSYKSQTDAASKRLSVLGEQVRRFFLDKIRRIEQDGEAARQEWDGFVRVGGEAIQSGRQELERIRTQYKESLEQRCDAFARELAGFDKRAVASLQSVFKSWEDIHQRTLQSAVKSGGVWRNYKEREFDLNMDVAGAYLKLVPFVWDDFFGAYLSELTDSVSGKTNDTLRMTAKSMTGAMAMLRHQPAGLADSMTASLETAKESGRLRTDKTRAELTAHIQRTRQALSTGMVKAAAGFMKPAYGQARLTPDGKGIKRRMLDILTKHAREHAPKIFVTMRQDLVEGVTELRSSMTPLLARIVDYGSTILDQFEQNLSSQKIPVTVQFPVLEVALRALPQLEVPHERLSQEAD
jgi:GTPase SAR1 family protein